MADQRVAVNCPMVTLYDTQEHAAGWDSSAGWNHTYGGPAERVVAVLPFATVHPAPPRRL